MKSDPSNYTYILNGTDEKSPHHYMAAISAHLLRMVDRDATITFLADSDCYQFLKSIRSPALDVCDFLQDISTPKQSVVERNRFIKTQLPQLLGTNSVYLDNDTLPIKSPRQLFSFQEDFGAVPDPCECLPGKGVPESVSPYFEKFEWSYPRKFYLNGGVFFFRATEAANDLFQEWHRRWKQSCLAGCKMDQPSLNSLWSDTKARIKILPRCWNAMVEADEGLARNARIYHYFTSYSDLSTYLVPDLIEKLRRGISIESDLERIIDTRYIWANKSHARRHWNTGNYLTAVRIRLKKSLSTGE